MKKPRKEVINEMTTQQELEAFLILIGKQAEEIEKFLEKEKLRQEKINKKIDSNGKATRKKGGSGGTH